VPDVRTATAADAPEVGRVLAAGFADDPVMAWMFDAAGRDAKLAALFGFFAEETLVPLGATYLLPGACAGWTPPGTPPWSDDRTGRFLTAMAAVCSAGDLERLGVIDEATRAQHPAEPHWYLGQIAVEPRLHGTGVGSRLLAHSLAVVDADELPAYLESSNPRNVSLYLRHGFDVIGSIDLPDGPSLTPMWRPARPDR
jgi:ribosomal protein S18 acetylase RimI-like enzyme